MVNKSDQHDNSVLQISNADVTASDQLDMLNVRDLISQIWAPDRDSGGGVMFINHHIITYYYHISLFSLNRKLTDTNSLYALP